MAKVPGSETTVELLVNCKTYPSVSRTYFETVCTGGVQKNGDFVRLYPVPFRFLDPSEQYKRWDLIRVKAYRDTKDTRPESWHLEPGMPIDVIGRIENEKQRWEWMRDTVHRSAEAMDADGVTNGCVEIEPVKLYFEPDEKEWTASQIEVINQGDLFTDPALKAKISDRVPWQFRLEYKEKLSGKTADGKVLAWSYYEGFRRNKASGMDDQAALEAVANRVRGSIFSAERTVFAILGTHSRFGNWMISALYHVPSEYIRRNPWQGGHLF